MSTIISSLRIPALLKPEALILMDSAWMSQEVRWSIDGWLSVF